MPVTIKKGEFKYKDPETGTYKSVDAIGERNTSEQIAAIQQKGDEVLRSIPSDYTSMSNQVDDLNVFSYTSMQSIKRIYPILYIGAINVETGSINPDATNRMYSDMIPTNNLTLEIARDYSIYVVYYNSDGSYSGKGDGWEYGLVAVNNVHPYCRILVRHGSLTDFTGHENNSIVGIRPLLYNMENDVNKANAAISGYYFRIYAGALNINTGNIQFSSVDRAITELIPRNYEYIFAENGYSYYICYYSASLAFVTSSGWSTGETKIDNYPYFRVMFKNDNVSDFTSVYNDFAYLSLGYNGLQKVYTVGQNDNVAQIINEAMQYKGSVVYIEPYEHDCIQEWEAYYGSGYFANFSSGRGLELKNDIHIIGRSGHKLKCYYTGDNDVVMENFSLFNNCAQGSGYTLENLNIDTKKIRYCVHDERGSDVVPYKTHYLRCIMSQDMTGSTWDHSRACIGGGLGAHADVTVEDCIFTTVVSSENKDSLAYHNSASSVAESSLVIKNCYCTGTSTIQLAAYGTSTAKTKVLVANCSVGSEIEIYDWGQAGNFEYYFINNEVRSS